MFIKNYQLKHHYKSRSDVIKETLRLLQQIQLEICYREANQELEQDFDNTAGDGIDDHETW